MFHRSLFDPLTSNGGASPAVERPREVRGPYETYVRELSRTAPRHHPHVDVPLSVRVLMKVGAPRRQCRGFAKCPVEGVPQAGKGAENSRNLGPSRRVAFRPGTVARDHVETCELKVRGQCH